MAALYFVWLGSGRSRRRKVGLEGRLIDQAGQAGLPVPPGAILLDEFYRVCLEKGLAETAGNGIIVPDPTLIYNTLFYSVRLPQIERTFAVVPISPAGDSARGPIHGIVDRFNVNPGRPDELAKALATAWASFPVRSDDVRRDLLLIEEVGAEHHGRAWLHDEGREEQMKVHVEHGQGGSPRSPLMWHGINSLEEALAPFARRLMMLVRGVRRTLGRGDWEIEWADDGLICRLLWIGPSATSPSGDIASP